MLFAGVIAPAQPALLALVLLFGDGNARGSRKFLSLLLCGRLPQLEWSSTRHDASLDRAVGGGMPPLALSSEEKTVAIVADTWLLYPFALSLVAYALATVAPLVHSFRPLWVGPAIF